jgi:hypothetical protein
LAEKSHNYRPGTSFASDYRDQFLANAAGLYVVLWEIPGLSDFVLPSNGSLSVTFSPQGEIAKRTTRYLDMAARATQSAEQRIAAIFVRTV